LQGYLTKKNFEKNEIKRLCICGKLSW